jgi:ATP-binding cassette, subfamily F, member 3
MAEILFNCDKIAVALAGRLIFKELSWEVQNKQRIGLVGPNGAGKTTLLRLIAQELPLDDGQIYRKPGVTWGRLEQEPDLPPGRTVMAEALTAVPALATIESELARLEQQMGDPSVYSSEAKLAKVMAAHEKQLVAFAHLDGASYQSRIKETLTWLGFEAEQWDILTDHLSGGQKKMVLLAKLIVQQPQLLLLDEPDNHLDLVGKQNLERIINAFDGCVVIISHDRYLLDEVATHIAELENGRLTLYPGSYTAYANERALRRLRQQQMYLAQQKEIARIEAAIARFKLWASLVVNERHIKQARSRRKMLDKMDKVERVNEQRRMTLNLSGWRGSNKVIEFVDVVRMLENGRFIFDGLNATLWHGDRVGLVGTNGAGKSMLLKQILSPEGVDDGRIIIGPSSKIGYYAQEHDTLNYERDLITEIRQAAPLSREAAVAFLHKFLYSYEQMQHPISKLSGGERSRLQLAKLVLERPNLLILDEPTNNLDIASIEVLEQTLEEFEGTMLVVSHDRYFLDQTVDRILALEEGLFSEFSGGYTDYLAALSEGDIPK